MKRWSFKRFLCVIAVLAIMPRTPAANLRPDHISCQTGGGMGAATIGTGWSYGNHHRWETELFVGFVPKYDSGSAKVCCALKENFVPWHIKLNDHFTLKPLTTSIYFTTLMNRQVWTRLPERYSSGYYFLPTKIRTNIALGQRIRWTIPKKTSIIDSVSAYYEIGTCDIYVLSAVGNSSFKLHELLQLCLGLRINF